MAYHEAVYDEPLIFEYRSGTTYKLPGLEERQKIDLPENLLRKELNLPEVSEYDVVRHYTRLSQMNYSVDLGIYPLGSCTMKFNPKYADAIASSRQFSEMHPLQLQSETQGELRILYELQEYLKAISDMDAVTLQPLAGAQG